MDLLKDRQQKVCVDKVMASFLHVKWGVSQGTVLRPELFTIMVNDTSLTSHLPKYLNVTKYADDITSSITPWAYKC